MFRNFAKMFALALCAAVMAAVSARPYISEEESERCRWQEDAWGRMCSRYSCNVVRGCDRYGCGHYGAKRGSRLHKGVDVLCPDWSFVYAPFTGSLMGPARPYINDNAINDGVKLQGSEDCVKIFYIHPIETSGSINEGDILGFVLPMQSVYPGISSHIHIQNCDTSMNPTHNL